MKNKFSENYKYGFDFWVFVLVAFLFLPYLVYWCMPAYAGLDAGWLTILSHVLCALSALPLILVVKREREKKPLFDTAFTTLAMLVILYLTAWIIFFCGKTNFAVTIFVMISPALSMLVTSLERKNFFSLPFAALCLAFSLAAALTIGFSM